MVKVSNYDDAATEKARSGGQVKQEIMKTRGENLCIFSYIFLYGY